MENKIPIDDLFRDRLLDGREPLNLGAWANMERMLDGKNPYIQEEKKKRRFIFPFLLSLGVTLGIVGAGYLINNLPKSKKKKDLVQNPVAFYDANINSNVQEAEKSTNAEESVPSRKSYIADQSSPVALRKPITKNSNTQSLTSQQNTSVDLISDNQSNSEPSLRPVPENENSSSTRRTSGKKNSRKANGFNSSLTQADVKDNPESIRQSATSKAGDMDYLASGESRIERIPMVTVSQKTIRGRDGGPTAIVYDTIEKAEFDKVIIDQTNNQAVASLDWRQTNPRYKLLNDQEAFDVQQRLAEESFNKLSIESAGQKNINQPEITVLNASKSAAKTKHSGNLVEMKNAISHTYQKIFNKLLFRPKPDVYTGMLMGFNASLSNSKHNFGGFHGGMVLLRPVNDYFSFITECKFYYRNNGGYTVNDITQRILDKSTDNSSLAHLQHSIYSYQKDSMVKTYNFKRFYSIELPLMMQFNYRSFALYGGINLAYNIKLRTTVKSQNYVSNIKDTLLNSEPYSYPNEKLSQLQPSDFGARLGIGYTVGAAFNFSPQMYLDLRLTQNIWDNKRSIIAREISNGVYKVPTLQVSLGYRFRKFTPEN